MVNESTALTAPDSAPAAVIAAAKEQATLLMNIVNSRRLFKDISGKKYLLAEAWEIIDAFNNAHPIPIRVERVEVDGTPAYEAEVHLMKDGEVISGGIMTCGFDDFPCKGKEGTARVRAAQSAAQTWATSKASRIKFAWVAVMAGFEPTPAEEMGGQPISGEPSQDRKHWCSIHNVPFFKKGRMKGYAHKIEGTDEWCNEQTIEEEPPPISEPQPVKDGEADATDRDPDTLQTINALTKACHKDFGMQPDEVYAELGVKNASQITDKPTDCYRRIAAVRGYGLSPEDIPFG